ncbi:MAG TPA: CDP-alcohol phosphatidyltransferase family protein [Bacteroidales bacterium]|nr:CDP-alcohol phosphatidyltransferase family protein [Bacteroidales bacterium]
MAKGEFRIQKSILAGPEKKALTWIASHLPRWINPDSLTTIGFIGSLLAGAGYFLTNYGKGFLWLSSLGFIINWFGDSLDGTLARVRKIERPIYGFYIDHNMDALTALVICIGAGLSPFVSFSAVMLILAGYYLLSIFTYINVYLNEKFVISYYGFGPTELRLAIIILNGVFFFLSNDINRSITLLGIKMKYFDIFVVGVFLILMALYLYSFLAEKKNFEKADPIKNSTQN